MFTGLVERVGTIIEIAPLQNEAASGATGQDAARRLVIEVGDEKYLADAEIGESIAVCGTCLTAVELASRRFVVEAVEETMRRTSLGAKQVGSAVNLERALRADARLGGHIVQGHVDGVGGVASVRDEGESLWVTFEPPFDLMRYIVEKGSICIDGISLTVANVAYARFSVALIPHTLQATTAKEWQPGVPVNLEVDIIAKYVERLTQWNQPVVGVI